MVPVLHERRAVGRRSSVEGFTLIELMVVVVIVGVLAAVAAFAYTKYIRKARTAEVTHMFGELSSKEELFHAEFGRYLATGDWHPATVNGKAQPVAPLPATWQQLKVQPGRGALYCQYQVFAGDAGTAPSGTYADLYPTAPDTNWYYMAARCDFDGDGKYSTYLRRGGGTELIRENEGE